MSLAITFECVVLTSTLTSTRDNLVNKMKYSMKKSVRA